LIVVPTCILYFQFLNSLGNIDTEGKNNNNNNNNNDEVSVNGGVIATRSIAEVRSIQLLNVDWPPTLEPSQTTWALSPPVCCYRPHSPSPILLLLGPKAGTHY